MMFVVDAAMSGVTIVLLTVLLIVLHYKAPIASWGSISQALIFHQVKLPSPTHPAPLTLT